MHWLLLISISVTVSSLAAILQRVMLRDKDSDPYTYSVLFQYIVGVIIGIFALLTGNTLLTGVGNTLPNLLFMTLLYAVGNVFIFTALKQTDASKFVILFASRALFSTLGFVLLLNQEYGLRELMGTILIVISLAIVNYKKNGLAFNKSDIPALLAGLFFGIANINDKIILNTVSLYAFVVMIFIFPATFMLIIKPSTFTKIKMLLNKVFLKTMFTTSFLYGFGALTFFYALKVADFPSKVVTVNLTGVIMTVFMGIFLLKEKENAKLKILGAIVSVIGVYLVS